MPGSEPKKFVFNNDANALFPLVLAIIEYARQNIQVDENTEFKLKMILIELLTNSLKHSGQDNTVIEITTAGDKISIRKTDAGNGLAVRCDENLLQWPLPGRHHADKIITIYSDSSANLKAKLHNNCCLQFFIEETEEANPVNISSLAEHFGFMIITRACDTFEYEFDIGTCTNSFIIVLAVYS